MKLTIVMPVFNEERSVRASIDRVRSVRMPEGVLIELIVVDDCSTDATPRILEEVAREHPTVRCLRHTTNRGKGAALRTGFAAATGDCVIVQDADLEYDPAEIPKLLKPIMDNVADVVFGSRFIGGESHRVLYYWHSVGNRVLTTLSNMVTNLNLTDMEVCYKMFRKTILDQITIEEDRFGFEPEVTAKVAKIRGVRIYEVGISYSGRTYEEGKKITWRDGVRALVCILKYGLLR